MKRIAFSLEVEMANFELDLKLYRSSEISQKIIDVIVKHVRLGLLKAQEEIQKT